MTLSIVYSRRVSGIKAPLVTVETHISRGMPGLNIVGLPETAVKESKDRVRSALINAGLEFPRRRITINLAPADLPKEGGRFDLPIALGILAASGQIPQTKLMEYEFTGELALSGELRPVLGVLPMVLMGHQLKRTVIVPEANAQEAALVNQAQVLSAKHLLEVCAHLKEEQRLPVCIKNPMLETAEITHLDLAEVRGQEHAKRALEVAAAGKHNLLFVGSPGTGKTMLISRFSSILPLLDETQSLEVAALCSVSHGGFDHRTWGHVPFRSPHHSSSAVALVGGGRPPRPGEISLAHCGVLFLDELPEFGRHVLESLREPLEAGRITISRASYQTEFPAKFQLIAAMNPCPCGYFGSIKNNCRCTEEQVHRYLGKLSGPLLDRIDMHVDVPSLPPEKLLEKNTNEESSAEIKARVMRCREFQLKRQGKCNAEMTPGEVSMIDNFNLPSASHKLLNQIIHKFNLSARSHHRILKVARTIADLDESDVILTAHISEALTFRCLDRLKLLA